MNLLERILGDPEKPIVPGPELVPDVEFEGDEVVPDEGDADGQEKARRKRGKS